MTTKHRILIVDDDKKLAQLTADYLTKCDFTAHIAHSGQSALERLALNDIELVVLDLMLPDIDGFEICKQIRLVSDLPILMLTARNNDFDMVVGLDAGCDDYVAKPVAPRVLLARIKALLRRGNTHSNQLDSIQFGSLSIDKASRLVTLGDQNIDLTSHEFDLLWTLAKQPGKAISRNVLFSKLVGREYDGMDRTMDIRISSLRKKLLDDTRNPFRIKTIWGQGYQFVSSAWE
jgi:two-component system, OmpR family, response regulator